ncbi:type I-E CRISPR-associated protein Cse2/CasB [Amaricoccus solimangrovi]|uniref:Type I-E CRISPR-associated protein Cse2/CasB n=1 Tax=Amaricoccus solimangrovi TaxID=2589815 RepID=A0A501WHN8_9RHOB|nr:type I-E CRISPR-associated protein Cse2/CasB [Amaricoccus solimangrovi]TPE47870.1 hypothetical protein FJM51_19220 [Amaricoccus solimangrovi]
MNEPKDTGEASAEKSPGQIILGWWTHALGDRQSGRARALAARLRRASPIEALAEPEVHDLARALDLRDGARLARLVTLLAEVREHVPRTLARRLGGADPALSPLRFQRLMRSDGTELAELLRRAIGLADRACNVAALGEDLLRWTETTRARWCFHYFDDAAETPRDLRETLPNEIASKETTE